MDYKEKYKKALEKAKEALNDGTISCNTIAYLQYIFHELKESEESEDKRIRKWIIDDIRYNINNEPLNNSEYKKKGEKAIAWLEKQGQVKESSISQHEIETCKENNDSLTSKDERIRKALIDFFNKGAENGEQTNCVCDKDILAWLKKQGNRRHLSKDEEYTLARIIEYLEDNDCPSEWKYLLHDVYALPYKKEQKEDVQNIADKVEPKSEIIQDTWYTCTHTTCSEDSRIWFKKNTPYLGKEILKYDLGLEPNDYQDYFRLWTIQDAKDGDVLANDHHILILKEFVYDWSSNRTPNSVKAYCGIKPKGNFEIGRDNWCFCGTLHIHPATKEQRDTLFAKMKEAGYEWDAEKKKLKRELKKIEDEEYDGEDWGIDSLWHAQRILEKTLGEVEGYQTDDGIIAHKCAITAVKKLYGQKPADWSEEDERTLQGIIDEIQANKNNADYDIETYDRFLTWLNSLRPQKH